MKKEVQEYLTERVKQIKVELDLKQSYVNAYNEVKEEIRIDNIKLAQLEALYGNINEEKLQEELNKINLLLQPQEHKEK